MKKVVVNGANGRMGREVVKLIIKNENTKLIGAVDRNNVGKSIIDILKNNETNYEFDNDVLINDDLKSVLAKNEVDLVIDFTTPEGVMNNIRIVLNTKADMIVGTTGITDNDIENIREILTKRNNNIIIAPNFALGAVLMMKFSQFAAKYMDDVEIIELHHDKKVDAPSGTSIKTAELISENMSKNNSKEKQNYLEKIEGVRGGKKNNINIHSIRMKGLLAHQEVIFGTKGQTLTLKHDSYDRSSFMPGIALAINKIDNIDGLIYGLEKLI